MSKRAWAVLAVVVLGALAAVGAWKLTQPKPGDESSREAAKAVVSALNSRDEHALSERAVRHQNGPALEVQVKRFMQKHPRRDYQVVSAVAHFPKHSTLTVHSAAGNETWNLTWVESAREYRLQLPK